MPALLPNTTTTDNYRDCTLGGDRGYAYGTLTIANNPVSVMLQHGARGAFSATEYTFVTPSTLPLVGIVGRDEIVGVQIKSAIPGTPAQVSGWLVEPNVAGIQPGSAYTSQVSSGGSITPPAGSVITYTQTLPAAPTDGEIVGLVVDAALYPGVVWLLRYNSTLGYWEFMGGSPIEIIVNTLENLTAVGWQNAATDGPLWAALWAGDYMADAWTSIDEPGIGGTQLGGLAIAVGNVAGAVPYVTVDLTAVLLSDFLATSKRLNAVPLGGAIKHRYYAAAANALRVNSRVLHVKPVRIQ